MRFRAVQLDYNHLDDLFLSIGESAFSGCVNLTLFQLPDKIESEFDQIDDLLQVDNNAFENCKALSSFSFPGKYKVSLGKDLFVGCSGLKNFYCYMDCLPKSGQLFDESISNATLHTHDYTVELFKESPVWNKFKYIEVFEKITDFNLTYYLNGEFYKEYKHKYEDEITPEVEPVKDKCLFSGWEGEPKLMPGKNVDVYGTLKKVLFNITYLVDGAEYKVIEMKCGDAIVPEAEPTKKGMTFSGWSDVPETMPEEDLTIIGTFSWSKLAKDNVIYEVSDTTNNYCRVICNSSVGGEIKIITPAEIDGCVYKVTEIANKAFYGCKDITKIEIPNTVINIGERAFANIDKLTDVTICAENVPETDRTAFENSYVDYATLHVPYGSVDKYKAVGPWKDFKEIVAIEGTQRTFVLTYKVDGEVFKTYEIKEGETITPEAEPIKEGYTFSGWSDIPAVMPSEDLTITGTFTINKYKLTYIVDEKEYKVFEVEYNATITPVPAPEKEGYTFSGWSEIPEKMPAKDVTVTGAFTINKYKLLYMVDDTVYDESEVEYGAAITPLEAPAKEGYTFSGWSEIPETMPAKDVTVTGTFTINKYKLTYMVDGEVYKTYDVEYGATVTPEAEPTKEGYTFSGWSTIPDTMPANDVTVTGSFTKGAYKLIYKIDGEVYKTYTYDFGAEITPEPAPEKEGYSFLGWSDIPEIMPANDVEVTGSFTVNKYNLIYKVDGDVYKEYEMEYGAEITPEEEPTKEGWEFSGWSWIPKKMPAEDVVITGTFKQLDYAVDGGTFTIDDGEATLKGGGEAKGALVINNNVTINGKVYVVVNIGNGAFKGNKDITSVELPDGIKNIGAGAFDGCSSLLKVLLGKGVKKIGSKAFGNIWKAAAMTRAAGDGFRVECNAESVPEIETDAFEGTEIEKATLVVKDELVNSYKTAEVWKNFGSIIGQTEATDIDGIFTDNPSAVIYSIDGRRLDKVQKGMNVIRTEKGVKKVVVR